MNQPPRLIIVNFETGSQPTGSDRDSTGRPAAFHSGYPSSSRLALKPRSRSSPRLRTPARSRVRDNRRRPRGSSESPCSRRASSRSGMLIASGQMPRLVFVGGPHVEHGDDAVLDAARQFGARDGLERVPLVEVSADRPLARPRGSARRPAAAPPGFERRRVAQTVEYPFALAPRGEQARPAHHSQVLRRVGDRQSDPFRERFDASLALGELLENFQPWRCPSALATSAKAENTARLASALDMAAPFKRSFNDKLNDYSVKLSSGKAMRAPAHVRVRHSREVSA